MDNKKTMDARKLGPRTSPRHSPPKWPPSSNGNDHDSTAAEFEEWYRNYERDQDAPNKFSKRHGEVDMSNKFLPFVVENSTPTHMFKTLMSRSKGMNQVLIASIFHLILKVNIKKLRAEVKELPEMPLEKLYEELLIQRPAYRVQDEVLADYQTIYKFFPAVTYWSEELQKYSAADAMLFFCSMAYAEKPILDYTEYPYDLIRDADANREVMDNIQHWVKFDDKGIVATFDNAHELRCYVLYHGLFRNMMEPDTELKSVKAVIARIKS